MLICGERINLNILGVMDVFGGQGRLSFRARKYAATATETSMKYATKRRLKCIVRRTYLESRLRSRKICDELATAGQRRGAEEMYST
jgi:hypothetical protein